MVSIPSYMQVIFYPGFPTQYFDRESYYLGRSDSVLGETYAETFKLICMLKECLVSKL